MTNGIADRESNDGLPLIGPRVRPALDPMFRPAALAVRNFRAMARAAAGRTARLALEQSDGSVFHLTTELLPDGHPQARANRVHLERLAKFALWSRGGFRLYFDGPPALARALTAHYA